MDMIFEIEYTKKAPVPTLTEFLKDLSPTKKLKSKYAVTHVWKPGKYPTLTFQTEDFRAVVYENNPLYGKLLEFAETCAENETHFALVVERDSPGAFKIVSSGEAGKWEPVGERGLEFKFTVRRK